MYWTKDSGDLAALINKVDNMSIEERAEYGKKAKERIKNAYSWSFICDRYADVFELRGIK